MSGEIISNNFVDWLKSKKTNDYLFSPDTPPDYAIQKYNHNKALLEKKELRCYQLTWFLTNRCDLACSHCGVSANERKFSEISFDDFKKVLPGFSAIGLEVISLSGGEPLVRKDVFEIMVSLKYLGFKVGMVTNASRLKDFCKKMTDDYKLDTLSISIDGLAKNHGLIRKNDRNFQQALDGIKAAKDAGVNMIAVHTCIYPGNLDDLEELKEIIFSLGIDQWILRPVTPSGRASSHSEFFLNYLQIKDLLLYAKNNLEKGYDITVGGDLAYLGKLDSYLYLNPFFSSAGWNNMVLLPNGDIKGFDEIHLPAEGNILKDKIEDIWYSGFQYYREPFLPDECLSCEYFSHCRGGNIPGAELGNRCIKPVLKMLENEEI